VSNKPFKLDRTDWKNLNSNDVITLYGFEQVFYLRKKIRMMVLQTGWNATSNGGGGSELKGVILQTA
jgi:hypothetical protein